MRIFGIFLTTLFLPLIAHQYQPLEEKLLLFWGF